MRRTDVNAARRAVLETLRTMDREGLTTGTAGNVSARAGEDHAVLSPTALAYADMTEDDLVLTTLEGEVVEGHRAPTTELDLHLSCLRAHPEIGAVVHTHAVFASMFAVANAPIPCLLEEFEYYVGGDVLVAPYHRTGTRELGEAAAKRVGDRAAVLLANHGLVVVGRDPAEALQLTRLVERAAQVLHGARLLGDSPPLPEAIREEFAAEYLARRHARG